MWAMNSRTVDSATFDQPERASVRFFGGKRANRVLAHRGYAELTKFQAGEVVHTIRNGVTSVYFIVTGRVRVTLKDPLGGVATQDWMTRGRVLGLFAIGLTDHSQLHGGGRRADLSHSPMKLPELLRLSRHADFQLALIGLASNTLFRRLSTVDRTLTQTEGCRDRPSVQGQSPS